MCGAIQPPSAFAAREPDLLAYIDAGNDHFDFAADESFTLEAVIQTTQSDSGGIIAKDHPADGPGWAWQVEGGGSMRLTVSDGILGVSLRSSVLDTVADGTWRHVAAVRDAALGELRLYRDYELIDTGPDITSGSLANDKDLLIGALHTIDAGFEGAIDHVRISRGVLDPTAFLPCTATPGDLNCDGECDVGDLAAQAACMHGPDVMAPPAACSPVEFDRADLDGDGDVDVLDVGVLMPLAGET